MWGEVWTDWFRRYDAGLFITLGFFSISVLTLPHYGQTWDEPEIYAAAFHNLRIIKAFVSGQLRPQWAFFHELPGYYFVFDSLRGAFAWLLSIRMHLMDDVLSFHFFHVLLSTLSVFLFYRLAHNVSGRSRIAMLSTLVLVLFPQFLAHSQNNPKDLPGLFAYVLAIYSFTRLEVACKFRDMLSSGLALGLALTTQVTGVFLLPLLGLWLVLTDRKLLKEKWRSYIIVPAVAVVTAFLCWPWLWTGPAENLIWAIRHIARLHYDDLSVMYLGTVYKASELPWHYFLVIFLATTPVLYLLFAGFSLTCFQSRAERTAASPRSAATLGWLWCAILVAAETHAPMRYDGIRHLLMIVPGFCLLAGVGLDAILGWIEKTPLAKRAKNWRYIGAMTCAAAAFSCVGVQIVRIHPYQNAYLNEVTNAWLAGNAEDVFEVEYWQQSYKEGSEWLNAHAEPDAEIYVAFAQNCADHYLNRKSRALDGNSLALYKDRSRARYLMLITRKAMFDEPIRFVECTYEPIFTIRRQKGTLLKVYSNRRLKTDSVS
jgi:4-amino-4-deoxy-L-arabinose transferase-like glycosyltransferase